MRTVTVSLYVCWSRSRSGLLSALAALSFFSIAGCYNGQLDLSQLGLTVTPPPPVFSITGIKPASILPAGGVPITITGNLFDSGTTVTINAQSCAPIAISGPTTITCVAPGNLPAGATGTAFVVVTDSKGDMVEDMSDLNYAVPPTIASVGPALISTDGGSTITISGAGFASPIVTVNGLPCTSPVALSAGVITCVAPPSSTTGLATIMVTDFSGNGFSGSDSTHLSYGAPPVIFSVNQPVVGIAGGTSLTINGNNFNGPTVKINGTVCPGGTTATTITCTVPPSAISGLATLTIINANGLSTSNSTLLTYDANPTVTSSTTVSLSTAGETPITLFGANFLNPTVSIGGNICTINSSNATQIICTAPGGTAGATSVLVTNGDGLFVNYGPVSFDIPPTILTVTPPVISAVNGGSITINGANFLGSSVVTVNNVPCLVPVVVNPNRITCNAQGSSVGPATVQVKNGDGIVSNINATDLSYHQAPVITGIFPGFVANTVGTTITISGSNFITSPSPHVLINGTNCILGGVTSASIQCQAPALGWPPIPNPVNVTVVNSDNLTTTDSVDLTYGQAPIISSAAQTAAPPFSYLSTAGGTPVTINGSNFLNPTVTINNLSCGVTGWSPNLINCLAPSNSGPGVANIVVSNSPSLLSGSNSTVIQYVDPPMITNITPAVLSSLATGGSDLITITGTGFANAFVTVNAQSCSNPAVSGGGTTIACHAPLFGPGPAPAVVVKNTVTNLTATDMTHLTYDSPPVILGVTPPFISTSGDTLITINGSGFSTPTVTVNNAPCMGLTVGPPLTCTAALGTQGPAIVKVTNIDGVYATYTTQYADPPAIFGITSNAADPATASTSGGTQITITGSGFGTVAPIVTVTGGGGSGACIPFGALLDTSSTCTAPALGVGAASVVVKNGQNLLSSIADADLSYVDPTILTITPTTSADFGVLATVPGVNPFQADFILKNVGTVPATNITIQNLAAPFRVSADNCPVSPATFDPNVSCTITVQFLPFAIGSFSKTLLVNYGDGFGIAASATKTLTGKGGIEARAGFEIGNYDFGPQEVDTDLIHHFKVINAGGIDATSMNFTIPSPYFIDPGTNCGATLPAGKSCVLSVDSHAPSSPGNLVGLISLSYDLGGKVVSTSAGSILSLSGTANAVTALSIDLQGNIDFGDVNMGDPTPFQTVKVTLTNHVPVGVFVYTPEFNNFPSDGYSIIHDATNDPCGVSSFTQDLPADTSCDLTIKFQPVSTGNAAILMRIDYSTDGFATASSLFIPLNGKGVADYLYTISEDSNGRVYGFQVDPTNGSLSTMGFSNTLSSSLAVTTPTGLAADPLGHNLFVLSSSTSAIDQFSISTIDGYPSYFGNDVFSIPGSTPSDLVVDPILSSVYVTDFSGKLTSYPVNSGNLTSVGSNIISPSATQLTTLVMDTFGRYLFSGNPGAPEVTASAVGTPGHPQSVDAKGLIAGASPQNLALDPSNRFLYTSNTGVSSISLFTVDTATGELTPGSTEMLSGTSTPQGMAIDPTGQFLYIAIQDTGGDEIEFFTIDSASGNLTFKSSFPSQHQLPTQISIDPSGQFLYVTCPNSGFGLSQIDAYSIVPTGASAGSLNPLGAMPVDDFDFTTPTKLTIVHSQ